MRKILLAVLFALGIGLAGAPTASAAPVSNGAGLAAALGGVEIVDQVQHWRWGSRRGGHWRWGSRGGHWRGGSRGFRRCHVRGSSRFVRC